MKNKLGGKLSGLSFSKPQQKFTQVNKSKILKIIRNARKNTQNNQKCPEKQILGVFRKMHTYFALYALQLCIFFKIFWYFCDVPQIKYLSSPKKLGSSVLQFSVAVTTTLTHTAPDTTHHTLSKYRERSSVMPVLLVFSDTTKIIIRQSGCNQFIMS